MGEKAVHPSINASNVMVNEMPAKFTEGNVIAQRDSWTEKETSHWVIREVSDSSIETDCGYKYELEKLDGSQSMYISHGELQIMAARNQLRFSA